MTPLVAIVGATATGKSELAVAVAERVDGEVVSVDASCVYRGLDVGTAKPSRELRARVPHHLLDLCDPREAFTAARFVREAEAVLDDLAARGRRAVLAGGTGLYLRALLKGLVASPAPDAALRSRLEARERARPGALHRLARRLDPEAARRLAPADLVRLVRVVEHRLATGTPLSADRAEWTAPERRPVLKLGLELPRDERERRIRARVDRMLAGGLVEEVAALLAAGVPPEARALRALGYREAVEHLAGRMPLDVLRERVAIATRQYAKRQDTWFRKEPGVAWLPSPRDAQELERLADRAAAAILEGRAP